MNTARDLERSERALSAVADVMRKGIRGEVSPGTHHQSKLAVLRALDPQEKRPSYVLPWVAAAAALLLMVVSGSLYLPARPLAFEGFDAHATDDGHIALEQANRGGGIRFSDGTVMILDRGARAQVVEVDAHGARLRVEDGRAYFHVVHKERARWNVAAGPYSVEVTGTHFNVSWSAAEQRFELSLEGGSVIVRGPQMPQGVRLAAGQTVVATAEPSMFRIISPGKTDEARPRLELEEQLVTSGFKPQRAHPAGARKALSWTERVGAGEFDSVLAEARARGLDTVLRQAPLSDLVALADAGRYSHEVALAQRALMAQRERFARSRDAHNAAFLLGRLSEDQASKSQDALSWYERYLREAPNGSFAPEALGRKMIVIHQERGLAAALPIARAYLSRFPRGPYAARAQELTQAE